MSTQPRTSVLSDAHAIVTAVSGDIRLELEKGTKPTAIAKALAPKGESPSWDTIRRAIMNEFSLPSLRRKKRGANASPNAAPKSHKRIVREPNVALATQDQGLIPGRLVRAVARTTDHNEAWQEPEA